MSLEGLRSYVVEVTFRRLRATQTGHLTARMLRSSTETKTQEPEMTNLKNIEWRGGTSPHHHDQRARSQRSMVEASLLRCAPSSSRRWDEKTHVEYNPRRAA